MTQKTKKRAGGAVLLLVRGSLSVIIAFPFVWMVVSSFKTIEEFYYLVPTFLPKAFSWDNYAEIIQKYNFLAYYKNSLIVTAFQVITNMVIVLCAGYGFAKFKFRGRNFLFLMILSSTMIPWVATIIPLYILATNLNLIDTMTGLMIPGMANAFNIFLARNFMTGIPNALLESARIEGAGEGKIFTAIVLPSVKPLISVITIQKMIESWNTFQWPLLCVQSDSLRTLPLAIAKLSSQYYDAYNLKMAAATLSIIPVLIIYIIFQKNFVQGVTMSGIK